MAASDVEAPYAVAPRRFPGRTYEPGPRYGYGPSLLPSTEVYTVLRDNGFSPLGIPRLRGFVYTIAVIDRGGEDGRLVIDARNGRIIRFMPAYRMGGDNYYEEQSALRGPSLARQPPQAQPPQAALKRRIRSRPRRARHGRPMLRAARCRCRRPVRSPPNPLAGAGPAGGRACAEIGRGAGRRPGDNRCGSGQARSRRSHRPRTCPRCRGWSEVVAFMATKKPRASLLDLFRPSGDACGCRRGRNQPDQGVSRVSGHPSGWFASPPCRASSPGR